MIFLDKMKTKSNSSYQQLNPTNTLNDFIDSYFESINTTSKPLKRTIFPDSFFKLIVNVVDNKISNVFLTGLWTKESKVIIPANATVYGVKFKILAPEYIFQREIASLIQSQEILDSSFLGIKDMKIDNLQDYVTQIEPAILKKLDQTKKIQTKKIKLSKLLDQSEGDILVQQIVNQTNWNSRSINRYFNKYLGIPLKVYLNIKKIYSSYIPIINKSFFPEKGFHDQSHFIREIKKHTNKTPKELEKEKDDRFIQLKNIQK